MSKVTIENYYYKDNKDGKLERLPEKNESSMERVCRLQIKNLTKIYKTGSAKVSVLNKVSFTVEQGKTDRDFGGITNCTLL